MHEALFVLKKVAGMTEKRTNLTRKKIRHSVILFFLLLLLWMLLTARDLQELITGFAVSLLIVLLTVNMKPVLGDIRLTPAALFTGIGYIFVFLKELLVSNLDVARRVLDPRLPIKPGIVKVRTRLRSDIGRMILANSITLTPGTLTVEIRDDCLYIHWIEIRHKDLEGATQDIVRKFEKYLEVIFG